MDWVRLGVRYFLDAKIRGLDGDLADAAEVMFVRSVAWAGEVKDDGFIPEGDVALLTRRRRHEAVVKVLVELGLWVAVPGGYRVVRWPDWNGDNIDALTRRRAADRERQRRRRERAKQSTGHLSRDASRDVTVAEKEEEKELLKGGEKGTARPSTGDPPPVENASQNGKTTYRPRCIKHAHDPDPPQCGGCRDARLADEQVAAMQATERAERDRRARDSPRCQTCTHPTTSTYHRRVCATERSTP